MTFGGSERELIQKLRGLTAVEAAEIYTDTVIACEYAGTKAQSMFVDLLVTTFVSWWLVPWMFSHLLGKALVIPLAMYGCWLVTSSMRMLSTVTKLWIIKRILQKRIGT